MERGMKNRVDWTDERLGSSVYEDMVAVLLSRLHPEAQRIDGSGGDGGRDVQLPLPTGLEIFELKSFTGRVGKSQRAQIQRSLKRAAAHNPVVWYLVVPIDHNDTELKWFEELTSPYSFDCHWRGKSWLDEKMAAHPDLPRYYLEGSKDEIFRLLKEINSEQAGLAQGAPDLVERVRVLKDRLNDLDPHYSFSFSVSPDGAVNITVAPRYPGAENDRPITIGGAFHFPDTVAGRAVAQALEDTFNYGTSTVIPAEYIKRLDINAPAGLGSTFEGGELRLEAVVNTPPEDLRVVFRIQDERGLVAAQMPFKATESTVGHRGGMLKLSDLNSIVSIQARIDAQEHRINLHYEHRDPPGSLPGKLLPAAIFFREMKPGRYLVMLVNGKEIGPPIAISESGTEKYAQHAAILKLIDDVQRSSGVYFPMPSTLTGDEVEALQEAHAYLTCEEFSGEWTTLRIGTTPEGLTRFQEKFRDGEVRDMWFTEPLVVKLGDDSYFLGVARKNLTTARIIEVIEAAGEASSPALILGPGADSTVTVTMLSAGEQGAEPSSGAD